MYLCVWVFVSVGVSFIVGGCMVQEERRRQGRMYRDYLRRVIESDYPVDSILSYEQWVGHMETRIKDLKQGQFPKEVFWSRSPEAV